eukprot:8909785-Ditylum_brightwellii.AAC.1
MLGEGSTWPLDKMDPKIRGRDLSNKPLSVLEKITLIPGVIMAPMNTMQQRTNIKNGMMVEEDRLINNQNFKWSDGGPVNSRVDKEALLP